MSKTIFISRHLEDSSPLWKLKLDEYEIFATSLLEITPLPFESVPDTDWLFFYSRNAVRTFFSQVVGKSFDATQFKIATIGNGTAEELVRKTGISADFVGEGNSDDIAAAFLHDLGVDKVCFVQGENSLQSIQRHLPNIHMDNLITYNNVKKEDVQVPFSDILVFTSPMNAQAYYDNNLVLLDQKVIAIGHTTSNALRTLGIYDVSIPNNPSEESIYRLIISLNDNG